MKIFLKNNNEDSLNWHIVNVVALVWSLPTWGTRWFVPVAIQTFRNHLLDCPLSKPFMYVAQSTEVC